MRRRFRDGLRRAQTNNEFGERSAYGQGRIVDKVPDPRTAAIAAMRERSSAAEILALYEAGEVTSLEMLAEAWEQCHDKPDLRAELVRQFQSYPDEYVARTVAGGLEELAAQVRERAKQQKP